MSNLFTTIRKKFSGHKVLLVGLGSQGGGEGVLRFFLKAGSMLYATDLRPKSEFRELIKKFSGHKVKFIFGGHRKADFKWADIVIKNPAVPYNSPFIKYAEKIGKSVLSETQIFFELIPKEKIIGITGTKGKTTAAMLLEHILAGRFKTRLVGNMPRHSALEALLTVKEMPDFFIYELSSFNLEKVKISPHYALITNIFPDHLNRYRSFRDYASAKANIFKNQTASDYLWLNKNDEFTKKLFPGSKSKIIFFPKRSKGSRLPDKLCFVSPTSREAAKSVASFLGTPSGLIKKRLSSFEPAQGRVEYLGKIRGVHAINDTTSTTPTSTIFSLLRVKECFKISYSKIILIAGGENKGLDYGKLSKEIKKLKKTILIPGSASEKIKDKNILRVFTLNFAVKKAFEEAGVGDCVIFSPAAASFNQFRNEFERGHAFKSALKRLS